MKASLIPGKFVIALAVALFMALETGVNVFGAADNAGSIGELEIFAELTAEEEQEQQAEDTEVKWYDNFTKKDLKYMSVIIFCEANNLEFDAKVAVANVILNRMYDTVGWTHVNTVKEVIYDRKWGVQFSPTKGTNSYMKRSLDIYTNLEDYKGTWKYDAMLESIKAAKAAFCGMKAVPDDFMFFNAHVESTKKKCEKEGRSYRIIGEHIYYE